MRKFVVRGGNSFEKSDGLSYVARLYNPAVDPATKKLNLKRSITIKPKSGSTIDVPQPPDEPMPVPEQQGVSTALVVDLAGAIVDVNIGDYFRPGEYTMTLKVTDIVAGKTVEAKAPFTLVAPPAPRRPAAKAARLREGPGPEEEVPESRETRTRRPRREPGPSASGGTRQRRYSTRRSTEARAIRPEATSRTPATNLRFPFPVFS